MRKFNEREKEIIRYLSLIDENTQKNFGFYLREIFFKEDPLKALFIGIEEETASLFFKEEKYDDVSYRRKELFYFIEALSLIQFLRNERLITIISGSNTQSTGNYIANSYFPTDESHNKYQWHNEYRLIISLNDTQGEEKERLIYKGIPLNDQIYNLLLNSIYGLAIVSEELKHLAKNNFETDEEIRFKETLKIEREQFDESLRISKEHFRKTQFISWIGIGIAIILGLWGILNRQTSTVKIEESQYKQAMQQADELKNQLKTYESKIDSLKVQINNNALHQKSPLPIAIAEGEI